ncbi:MAG TPA: phage tail protein [Candidatus Methylomirabilis sp.]|nr:phage tail protein [Candidatus Methylomirabilis sp.]HSC69918.1 phage tail protein [Candidatus Methylomirabilis sp.]
MSPLPVNALIAKAGGALGARFDPYRDFNFWVEIEGLIVGGFSEVSGLRMEVDVEVYNEGGLNEYPHQLPGRVRQNTITLKRGLSDMDTLWPWCYDVTQGIIKRRNLTVYLLDSAGLPSMWWDILQAYPVRWEGPELRATGNAVALESLVIAYHGLVKPASSQALSAARAAAGVVF